MVGNAPDQNTDDSEDCGAFAPRTAARFGAARAMELAGRLAELWRIHNCPEARL